MKNMNEELIKRFCEDAQARGVGKLRIKKYVNNLGTFCRYLEKPLAKATAEDLKKAYVKIDNDPRKYADNTKRDFKVILKTFYKFYKGNGEEFPIEVKWIKTTSKNHVLPRNLLSEEDIKKLIEASDVQDKCLISLVYESGARIGEIQNLTIGSISIDPNSYGAKVLLNGKTGQRQVLIYNSLGYIKDWLNVHPAKNDKEASLFTLKNNKYKPVNYAGLRKRLKGIVERAGLKDKQIHFHKFRKSRATFLASKLPEQILKKYMGWTPESREVRTYVHLAGANVDEVLLQKVYGLKQINEEAREEKLKPKVCVFCNSTNKPTCIFCESCKKPLELKEIIKFEEERKEKDMAWDVLKDVLDDELKTLIKKKIEERVKS